MFFQKNIKNVQVIFNAMHREVRHYISIHLKRIAILCQDKTQLAPLKKKKSAWRIHKSCAVLKGRARQSVSQCHLQQHADKNSHVARHAIILSTLASSACFKTGPPTPCSLPPENSHPENRSEKDQKNPNRSDRIIHPRVAVRGHVSGDRRRPGSLPLLIPLDRHFSASI